MPRTCDARHNDRDPQCQDRIHPNGMHHAHDNGQCLMWTDGGPLSSRPITVCSYPPAREVEAQAVRLTAKAEARRAERRVAAFKGDLIDTKVELRAPVEVLRPEHPGTASAVQWQVLCPVCGDAGVERDRAMIGERGEVGVQLRCAAGHVFELTLGHHRGAEYIAVTV